METKYRDSLDVSGYGFIRPYDKEQELKYYIGLNIEGAYSKKIIGAFCDEELRDRVLAFLNGETDA